MPSSQNALKAHGRKIRGISRAEKIQTIIHSEHLLY